MLIFNILLAMINSGIYVNSYLVKTAQYFNWLHNAYYIAKLIKALRKL